MRTLFIYNKIIPCGEKRMVFLTLLSFFFVSFFFAGCKEAPREKVVDVEDGKAKQMMQGIWIDEDEGEVSFRAKGDTIYYPDSISEPVHFYVKADSLILDSSHPTKYPITLLTASSLRFVNSEGDEVHLKKSNDEAYVQLFENQAKVISLNQGVLIKKDTVLTSGDVRYHAYVQVNPTSYKVYRQALNDDGVNVDNAYFDNIIHLALYENSKALVNRDYRKQDFATVVPKEFIAQCVLSDINVDKFTADGVCFIAILTIPDTYTSYNVKVFVSRSGKVSLSV